MPTINPPPPPLLLPLDLAQALVDYLGMKPYKEVANFIAALTQLPKAQAPQPAPPEPKPEDAPTS